MSKKKNWIIIVAAILVVVAIGVGVGFWIDNMLFAKDCCTDRVCLEINSNYKEKFLSEEFTLEDFKWNNVEKITYIAWWEKNEVGGMIVYLKRHGKWQVKRAIKHFETLDFVKTATVDGIQKLQ